MALKAFIGTGVLFLAGTSYWLCPPELFLSNFPRPAPLPLNGVVTSELGDENDNPPSGPNDFLRNRLTVPSSVMLRVKVTSGLRNESEALLENWDLTGTGLTKKDLAPFFTESQPESIVYLTQDGIQQIYPNKYEAGDKQSSQILYIGTEDSIKQTQVERAMRAGRDSGRARQESGFRKLPENAFEISAFMPGKRDNGDTLKPIITDFLGALQGPDYSMSDYDRKDRSEVQRRLATVLSLGHGGEILLQVTNNGLLSNEPGFDFSIFQTTFRIGKSKFFWHKFASVGVSDHSEPSSFKWFDCDPKAGILRGCAGAVPTIEGGDSFDLSEVGLKQIRYIWIKDLGNNKNISSEWPTEGISLDALRLDHAYTKN